MASAREVTTWQDVETARGSEPSGWFAVVGIVVAVFAALFLLVASTAHSPTTFDEVSQLTQAP